MEKLREGLTKQGLYSIAEFGSPSLGSLESSDAAPVDPHTLPGECSKTWLVVSSACPFCDFEVVGDLYFYLVFCVHDKYSEGREKLVFSVYGKYIFKRMRETVCLCVCVCFRGLCLYAC